MNTWEKELLDKFSIQLYILSVTRVWGREQWNDLEVSDFSEGLQLKLPELIRT